MNDLKMFENTEFGQMMILIEDGKELFPASQVAAALGYTNPWKAIGDHCRSLTKREVPHPQSIDKTMGINFIPEGDLYRLIVKSQLPAAERFERWVFEEVLPTIRKHGAYVTTDKLEAIMNDPDSWITMLNALKKERTEKEQLRIQTEVDRPKVLFADAVSVSDGAILIGELAKILKGNGVDIGQNRLFEKLRQDGYLIRRKGTDYNAPTQRAMELGLFKVKETAVTHSDGHVTVSKTTKVTGKGQIYFVNKFRASEQRGA